MPKIEDPNAMIDLINRCDLAESTKSKIELLLARKTAELVEANKRIIHENTSVDAGVAQPETGLLASTKVRHNALEIEKRVIRTAIRNLEKRGENSAEKVAKLAELEKTSVELITVSASNRQLAFSEILELEQKTRGRQTRALRDNDQVTVDACRKELVRLRKLRSEFIGRIGPTSYK